MKRIFGLFLSLLLCTSLFAQVQNVDDICSQLFVHKITKGDLTQSKTVTSSKRTREMVSTGKFILCEEGIVLQLLKPFANTLIITDSSIIKIIPDASGTGTKTVTQTGDNLVFANVSNCIKSLFSNDSTQLKQNFICEVTSNGNDWSLKLKPKDATIASALSSIIMEGTSNGKTSEIKSLSIFDISENVTKCSFSNQIYPDSLTSDDKNLFKED